MAAIWTIAPTVTSSTSFMPAATWTTSATAVGAATSPRPRPPSGGCGWPKIGQTTGRALLRKIRSRICSNDPRHVDYGPGPELPTAVRVAGRPVRRVVRCSIPGRRFWNSSALGKTAAPSSRRCDSGIEACCLHNMEELAGELVAFANAEGGVVFLGVDDSGGVRGIPPESLDAAEHWASQRRDPQL